ncbi:hypothetical protein Salat_2843200 [Sesamum alatum]|uniref:PGG domain-containing protein n=1 Tax=Sesamum alatum TaxID=300844 RepID=A0AAE2C9V2_9LAMI|nr:hypothetical protein Salat_2843200 [Sesamum alatum]
MLNAACSGDVSMLHQLLQENPFILSDYLLMNSHENPLTIATKANQLVFVREVLRLRPELAVELNQDGFRPLDVAAAYGHVEVAAEILAAGPENCRMAGRDGRTAIHYAAMNGRVEIIDQLMSACSDSAKDVTTFGETALHLAVKSFKFGALRSVLHWLEKVAMVEVVNWADKEGNTVLHYAASRKQLEIVELLLDWNYNTAGNRLDLNAVNKKGLTAIDIVDILIESSNDVHLREILRHAGGYASSEFNVVSERPKSDTKRPTNGHLTPGEKPKNWRDIIKHFEFQWQRDSPGEARETLLVVAALIATVTFEAGINPPSYLFEPSNEANITVSSNGTEFLNPNISSNSTGLMQRSSVETASMASITIFLVANSVALTTATSIIDYLTQGLPFQRELRVSMSAMIFAYAWSLGNTKPTGTIKSALLVVALSMPLFLRVLPYVISKLKKRNA